MSAGASSTVHFAAIQLDEVTCPSYSGTSHVAPSKYTGKRPGNPPANYGWPDGGGDLGQPARMATITNYVALAATHFPCMQYGPVDKLAVTTTIPADADAPNGMIVPGTGGTALNLSACTDGASKTLILCETIEPAMNCWYDGTTAWTTAINPNSMAEHAPDKVSDAIDGDKKPTRTWVVPAGGSTALNVGPDPTTTTAYCPALEGYREPRVISWGPSSQHAEGVVMHMAADASVHAIAPDIDPTLYMHLITRAGGEPDALPGFEN